MTAETQTTVGIARSTSLFALLLCGDLGKGRVNPHAEIADDARAETRAICISICLPLTRATRCTNAKLQGNDAPPAKIFATRDVDRDDAHERTLGLFCRVTPMFCV